MGLLYWTSSEVFTSKQQENHEVGGSLELSDVLLPLSVYGLSHHLQETLHQARLDQLQLYHIWQEDETFGEDHSEQLSLKTHCCCNAVVRMICLAHMGLVTAQHTNRTAQHMKHKNGISHSTVSTTMKGSFVEMVGVLQEPGNSDQL